MPCNGVQIRPGISALENEEYVKSMSLYRKRQIVEYAGYWYRKRHETSKKS